MQFNQVPIKTSKGLQEVGNRVNSLSMDARRILILINGKNTVGELSKKFAKFGPVETILNHLEIEGFISPDPTYTPPPATPFKLLEISKRPHNSVQDLNASPRSHRPLPVNSPHHPHPAEFNLEKAKGFIRFVLFGAMGPTAERRINRIDATITPQELHVELDAIRDMLPKVLSKKEAQQAWRQLEPIAQSLDMLSS